MEWRKIMGNCDSQDLRKLAKVVDGMKILDNKMCECAICMQGKMCQFWSPKPDATAKTALEFVHCDPTGLISPEARDGFKYALCFVDNYTGIIMVYFLEQKSDMVDSTKKFLADTAPYGKVGCIRSDNQYLSSISVHGPQYLSELLCRKMTRPGPRSANSIILYIPRTLSRAEQSTADRSFSISGPKLWNQLPVSIQNSCSLDVFKSRLKTFLFKKFFYWTPFNFIVTYVNSVFEFFLDMGTLKTWLFIIIIIMEENFWAKNWGLYSLKTTLSMKHPAPIYRIKTDRRKGLGTVFFKWPDAFC